jgi:hypothetical protein
LPETRGSATAELRPLGTEDHQAVAGFLAGFPGETRGLAHWQGRVRLWWEINPCPPGPAPRGWGLWRGGELVGCLGNIPTAMLMAGRPATAYNATAWKVLPEFRAQSLGLFFALMGAARDLILFCTTPNEVSRQVLAGLKFAALPHSEAQTIARLTYGRPLALRLPAPFKPLASLLAWPLNLAARLRLAGRRAPAGLEVRPLDQAGPEFDALWEATRGIYSTTNVRGAAQVNWICFGHPDLAKTLLGCFAGGRLAGYAILREVGEPGDRALECLDLWSDPARPEAVTALALGMVRQGRQRRADAVILHHFSAELGQRLTDLGLGRPKAISRHAYMLARGALANEAAGPGAYLSALQGDVGL